MMSDSLRARIGTVQLAHMPDDYQRDMGECPCGFKFAKWSELASHVADAVIAELGLQRDDKYDLGSYTPSGRFRYVTEWKADDE